MIIVFHNPRCTKSRECLAFLDELGQKYEIIKYLEVAPTVAELELIIQKLGIQPIDLVRKKEKIWIEKYKNQQLSSDEIVAILIQNPILIERPIIINGNKAVIGRPKEVVATII